MYKEFTKEQKRRFLYLFFRNLAIGAGWTLTSIIFFICVMIWPITTLIVAFVIIGLFISFVSAADKFLRETK